MKHLQSNDGCFTLSYAMTPVGGSSWLVRLAMVIAAAMMGACSPAGMVNLLVPNDTYQLVKDRPYGDQARQRLDIYRPASAQNLSPVVVFFHGGNWQYGSKGDYLFAAEALASRGFIVVIPDYRLYPEVRYPAFIEDGAAAVSWTLDHLADWGGDPDRVYLMGHSAGAYIAAMLALDGRWLGPGRARIRGTVGLAGPYDFLPLIDPALKTIFGTEPDLARTQPIAFVDGTAAPFLVISGDSDGTVRPGNSERLAVRLREAGGRVEEHYYKDVSHTALIAAMAAPLRFLAPVLNDVTEFLNAKR